MSELLKRLLSTVAFAPPNEGAPGAADDPPADDAADNDAGDTEADDAGDEPGPDDADAEAEEGAAEDDAVDAAADDDGEPELPSRGNRAIGALRQRARETAAENARLTRELAEARARPPAQQQVLETPQQRADRLALMSPEERMQEVLDTRLREFDQRSQAVTTQLLDQSDSAAFNTQAASNPVLKRLQPEVERRLIAMRQQGQNIPRHIIATYIMGERALAQTAAGNGKGRERQRQQQARPANGRSDAAAPRQRGSSNSVADIEKNFGDVQI